MTPDQGDTPAETPTTPTEATPPAETPTTPAPAETPPPGIGDDPATEPEEAPEPSESEEPSGGVEPVVGDQGEQVAESASAAAFDPSRPVRTSAPPPEASSGVPALPDGENDGVEPQPEFAGDVSGATAADETPEGDAEQASPPVHTPPAE